MRFLAVIPLISLLGALPSSDAFVCSSSMYESGFCPQVGVVISAEHAVPDRSAGPTVSETTRVDYEAASAARRAYLDMLYDRCVAMAEEQSQCVPPAADPVDAAPEAAAPAVAPITIADLVGFTPAVGELVVQPTNWGVLGVPTNFVATATEHVQQGTLLGQPVQVRWRPVAFAFDYGDGTRVTSTEAGALWRSTADDWSRTSTSHEYQQRGEYTASVTITFEADVGTGAGWTTVPGTLELAAPAEPVRVFEAQTVLTRGDCVEYPDDPGCAP